jgi:phosphodiesterase/alkaline phosphatase D-like protein
VDDKQSRWLARALRNRALGTDPKDLSKTAKNPIRLNPDHSSTVFRVRLDNLKPRTTYYYRVDSMESNGKSDGVTSPVQSFTTQ